MDARKMITRTAYETERAALVAMCLDIRTGRFGKKTDMYLYSARTAYAGIRKAFYARGNARNRKVV